jgi:putative inorganic carbon (HCO3(-)) transporter
MLFFAVMLKRRIEIGVVLTVAALLLFFATPLHQRVLTLIRPQTDKAINERMEAMKAGIELGFDYPVLGVGYGRGHLREALRERHGTAAVISNIAHTHNVYIELFAGTGILGLGAFLWLLWNTLYRAWQRAFYEQEVTTRIMRFGLLTAMVAFVVTGLSDVPFYHHETRIYFFTLLALTHLSLERVSTVGARPT